MLHAVLPTHSSSGSEGRQCFPCALNKRPASPNGFLDASIDPIVLKIMVAVSRPADRRRTGIASGIDVLDLDRQHRDATVWWRLHRDCLPITRVHRIRSGGLHLLFQNAPGLRCSAGRIAMRVDVRGDGGYVIWWPAMGLPVLCDGPVAWWPEWLRTQLVSQNAIGVHITVPDGHVLERLVRLVASACEGERNNLTY